MQWTGGYFLQSCTCPLNGRKIACENSCFSLLFATGDVSRGGTSATQWQKFHTDDGNQCLHNKINAVVMGFPLQICSILLFS